MRSPTRWSPAFATTGSFVSPAPRFPDIDHPTTTAPKRSAETIAGQSIVLYGIVIVLAAWLAGPSRWATSVRRTLTPYLGQPSYSYGGLAMLLLLLFWWDPVIATHRIVPSLLLIAFAVLGTEMLRRQVIREFPDLVTTGSPTAA